MDKVDTEIESVRAHVFELKHTLYRADRAHANRAIPTRLSFGYNLLFTCLLGLFFLLV
ncbi:MAG: hypothetical protein OIF58_02225 [Cohaesibacter sp.]|nr:hypothetical protein [Cohaesibacter sp.]